MLNFCFEILNLMQKTNGTCGSLAARNNVGTINANVANVGNLRVATNNGRNVAGNVNYKLFKTKISKSKFRFISNLLQIDYKQFNF